MKTPPRIAVLGLGEAGSALAADLVSIEVPPTERLTPTDSAAGGNLVAGLMPSGNVRAFDPAAERGTPAGVVRCGDPGDAVAGADLVLAVTPASGAAAALASVVGSLAGGATYADLSTSSPGLKQQLAETADAAGIGFVDVALMAPVPGNGIRTPALASGPAADAFAAVMRPLGMPVDVVGPKAGEAATRKLLRSVVMKGLAQLLIEALAGARAAGLRDEVEDDLVAQLSSIDAALVDRLVTGTPRHAKRRLDEMEATVALLAELGVDATMSRATAARLRQLRPG